MLHQSANVASITSRRAALGGPGDLIKASIAPKPLPQAHILPGNGAVGTGGAGGTPKLGNSPRRVGTTSHRPRNRDAQPLGRTGARPGCVPDLGKFGATAAAGRRNGPILRQPSPVGRC